MPRFIDLCVWVWENSLRLCSVGLVALARSDSGGKVLLVIGSRLTALLIVKQYDVDMDCLEAFSYFALKAVISRGHPPEYRQTTVVCTSAS